MTTCAPPTTVARAPVNTGLVAMLNIALGQVQDAKLAVDLCRAPLDIKINDDGQLTDPYGIVYPLPSFGYYGDMCNPQRVVTLVYQITNVGWNEDQSQMMADRTREVVMQRNPNGDFTNPIMASDALVIDRLCVMQGGPEPSGGGLSQVIDKYNLEVSSV